MSSHGKQHSSVATRGTFSHCFFPTLRHLVRKYSVHSCTTRVLSAMSTKRVLDEDAYVAQLAQIIERDFFPELPTLRAQHASLSVRLLTLSVTHYFTHKLRQRVIGATATNEVTELREGDTAWTAAAVATTTATAARSTRGSRGSLSGWDEATPERRRATATPVLLPDADDGGADEKCEGLETPREERDGAADMTLSRFVATHTSEDNEAFVALQQKAVEAHKKRFHWAFAEDPARGDPRLHLLADGSWISKEQRRVVDEVCAPKGLVDDRPSAPDSWTFRARNPLLFPPELSETRDICRVRGSWRGGDSALAAGERLERQVRTTSEGAEGDSICELAVPDCEQREECVGRRTRHCIDTDSSEPRRVRAGADDAAARARRRRDSDHDVGGDRGHADDSRCARDSREDPQHADVSREGVVGSRAPRVSARVPDGACACFAGCCSRGEHDELTNRVALDWCRPRERKRVHSVIMVAADSSGLHKLVIIGGGPAGIGVFIRAARTGFLPRLLSPQRHGTPTDLALSERCGMEQMGVAVLHDGDASTFGAGNVGSYLINSNTFAKSLLSSVLDERPDLEPPETTKHTFLEHAREHESTRRLERIGLAPASLSDMGSFLQYVGGQVLQELARHPGTSKCLLHASATKFAVLESGVIRVEAQCQGELVVLHTEHLALATGGRQELPVLDSPALTAKLFTSDACLREDGFAALRERLLRAPDRKVCIVGGSHSSFSVAWLLLNKFGSKTQRGTGEVAKPVAVSLSAVPVQAQQQTPETVNATQEPTATEESVDPAPTSDPASDPAESPSKSLLPLLKAVVVCPVGVSDSLASSMSTLSVGKCDSVRRPSRADPFAVFKPKDITILHRAPIRCYYPSKKDAEADGADGSRVDRSGCVNTFTGLREDAKNLLRDVKAGKETRVRLFQVSQHGCQHLTAKAYESASAIVWCCGYKTRMIPALDAGGNALRFYEENGVVKLNLLAQLQVQRVQGVSGAQGSLEPFGKVYGLGLGFSLRAALDEMGTETRADGVTVYHRRGATLVLAAMFGQDVFGSDTKSFEEMVEKNDRKKRETQAAKSDAGASAKTATAGSGSADTVLASDKPKRCGERLSCSCCCCCRMLSSDKLLPTRGVAPASASRLRWWRRRWRLRA
ncbi:hypothetical protein PybrP1_012831, partial [[Pythium] brassicae (nom. inval.)]